MRFLQHVEILFMVGIFWVMNINAFEATGRVGWSQRQQPTRRSILRPLDAVAKSGGKLIATEEMFTKNVLSKDIPRPVLVFFSAPWYVQRV
jgi:hypothetical protein